jgi:hypothetical protein
VDLEDYFKHQKIIHSNRTIFLPNILISKKSLDSRKSKEKLSLIHTPHPTSNPVATSTSSLYLEDFSHFGIIL